MGEETDATAAGLRPEAVEPGTNVLVAGPAMTGKREVVFDLLAGAADRAAIAVTTKESAARARRRLDRRVDIDGWDLRVVDCVSRQRAVGRVEDTGAVSYVASAGDLTGVGIEVSGALQDFYHDPEVTDARVGLHSLSTMLMYADIRRVYQFVHVITGRVESSDFAGVFSLDTVRSDTEAADRLTGLFDAMIEVRADPREFRVRGGGFGPRSWTEF